MQKPILPNPNDVTASISLEAQNELELNNAEGLRTIDTLERFNSEVEYLIKQQFANSLEQNRGERIKYAKYTFWLTVGWIVSVITIIILCGAKVLHLDNSILITLITTTTINVFGFFILVMQFLFNKEEITALRFLFSKKEEAVESNTKN